MASLFVADSRERSSYSRMQPKQPAAASDDGPFAFWLPWASESRAVPTQAARGAAAKQTGSSSPSTLASPRASASGTQREPPLLWHRCGKHGAFIAVSISALVGVLALVLAGVAWDHHPRSSPNAPGTGSCPLKAVGYAPIPLKEAGATLPDDDFMSQNTSVLWGSHGRKDLQVIRALGANAVRLYGNDPLLDHAEFLDEAQREGLQVVAGISDYPYTQMTGACKHLLYDCYSVIKEAYAGNLKRGFLQSDGQYHPALHSVVLINEPDLKLSSDSGVVGDPDIFCKAIISAFDAVLDAEKEAGVQGRLPNFTATFSYGVCYECANITEEFPAYGQMVALKKAMRDPSSIGYRARNDLWAAYQQRFLNSVNTENRAEDFQQFFLVNYDANFQGTPVFIGEYHSPPWPQRQDLQNVVRLLNNESTLLIGLAFFEFQVRYDKGGVGEMQFGMFGLGDLSLGSFHIRTKEVEAYCLKPVRGGEFDDVLHLALTEAFNGTGISKHHMCPDTLEEDIRPSSSTSGRASPGSPGSGPGV